MRRLIRWIDPGLLLTLALCALTVWPLPLRPGLPNGDDVLYHVHRAAEMDRAWSHGVLFPRWAEHFYTGYGAPVFHYYASFTYYATSLLMRVFTLNPVDALRLLIALLLLLSGAGMYGFMRAYGGRAGGVLAALAYVYSPYILFTEPYSRGAYPEMLAFALFPCILWSYRALVERGGAVAFIRAALLGGLLILTHNLMALVLTGLLGAWLVWQIITVRPRGAGLALLALALSLGLTAYFWIPVVSEGQAVKLANLVGVAELNYRNFFVPDRHLFAANPRLDAGAFNGLEHQLNLGLAQWLLALTGGVGAGVVWLKRKPHPPAPSPMDWRGGVEPSEMGVRFTDRSLALRTFNSSSANLLFFALASLVLIVLMLPLGQGIWGALAPLAFLQFPWRFLGPAALCLAVLVGMNAIWLERLPRWGGWLAGALLTGLILSAAPLLYIPEWTNTTVDTSVAAYHEAELKGLQRATTFSNEYLPRSVFVEPGATPRLLADYADGYPVNKAHLETLPPGVVIEPLEHGPQHDVWRVTASDPFTFEVLTYDWAGWQAEIDGQPVPITPSDPHGLITLPLPAGEHIVRVFLGGTPARDLGNAVSLLALAGLAATAIAMTRRSHTPHPPLRSLSNGANRESLRGLYTGALVTLIVLVVGLREDMLWVNSPPGEALLAQHQTDFRLGESIRLIGYDLNGDRFRPGDEVELMVYWYASAPIRYGYSSFVHISTGGPPLAQADKLNPAGLPTVTWPSSGFIQDVYVITLPTDIPAGDYRVMVGLYTCDTRPAGDCGNGDRLLVSDTAGAALGDVVPLASLRVE